MQTTRKATRYYIDRDADTPVIRSVPVARATLPNASTISGQADSATTDYGSSVSRRRHARQRLTDLLQATVRKHRNRAS
ncbi:MAG TPA: hypothetical protein VD789_01730 [Thermomicrobiales bacterium]|nr:hypothetical protein [Thermomicrobiales bacterium]